MTQKKREKKNPQLPPAKFTVTSPLRMIQFQDIPRDLQPLAVNIAKLEKAIMTTKNSVDMSFDHIIDKLVELKTESMTLIQQFKMLEKAKESE